MNSKASGLGSRKLDLVTPGGGKEKWDLLCFTTGKVGKESCFIEKSDRGKEGQQTIEADGAFDGHGL
jgi:hypothetical protein